MMLEAGVFVELTASHFRDNCVFNKTLQELLSI